MAGGKTVMMRHLQLSQLKVKEYGLCVSWQDSCGQTNCLFIYSLPRDYMYTLPDLGMDLAKEWRQIIQSLFVKSNDLDTQNINSNPENNRCS